MKLHLKALVAAGLAAGVSFLAGCDFVPWGNGRTYINMISVAGGTVPLTDTYKPTVSSFRMSETEITQRQWKEVVGNDGYGSRTPSDTDGKGDNFPMYYVSWYDALVFCNLLSLSEGKTPCYSIKGSTNPAVWGTPPSSGDTDWDAAFCDWTANGYRLPTEAEWEYAARGGKDYTYAGSDNTDEVAWYDGNSNYMTHQVKGKKPNGFGLYDMSGNVSEWCWDWSASSYDTSQTADPTGAASGSYRVNRGGSWLNNASDCAVSLRDLNIPSSRNYSGNLGFRVVCRP